MAFTNAVVQSFQFVLSGHTTTVAGVNTVTAATDRGAKSLKSYQTTAAATGKQLATVGAGFKSIAGAFTGIMAASAFKDMLVAFMKPAVNLEYSMARLKAMTGATKEEMRDYRNAAYEAARVTDFTPQQAIESLIDLRRATGDASTAIELLTPVMNLAQASFNKLSPAKATKMIGDMRKGFGMTKAEAVQASKDIYDISITAQMGIEDFSSFVMGRLGAGGFSLGRQGLAGFREITTAFALAARGGSSQPTRIATEMQAMFADMMQGNFGKGKDSLRRTFGGTDVMDVATGRVKDLKGFFVKLSEMYKEQGPAASKILVDSFSKTGRKAAEQLVMSLAYGLDVGGKRLHGVQLWDSLIGGKSKLEENKAAVLGTFYSVMQQLSDSVSRIAIVLGTHMLPAFDELARGANALLISLEKLFGEGSTLGWMLGKLGNLIAFAGIVWGVKATFLGISQIVGVVTLNLRAAANEATRLSTTVVAGMEAMRAMQARNAAMGVASSMVGAGAFSGPLSRAQALGLSMDTKGFGPRAGAAAVAGTAARGWLGTIVATVTSSTALKGALWGVARGIFKAIFSMGGVLTFIMFLPEIISIGKSVLAKFGWNGKSDTESAVKAAQEAQDKHIEKLKEAYQYFQIGTKQFDDAVSRLDKLLNYTPKITNLGVLAQAGTSLARLSTSRGLDKAEQNLVQNSLKNWQAVQGLYETSKTRALSSTEALERNTRLTALQVWMKRLSFRHRGLRPLVNRFTTEVAQPALAQTSPQGLAWAQMAGEGSNLEAGGKLGRLNEALLAGSPLSSLEEIKRNQAAINASMTPSEREFVRKKIQADMSEISANTKETAGLLRRIANQRKDEKQGLGGPETGTPVRQGTLFRDANGKVREVAPGMTSLNERKSMNDPV